VYLGPARITRRQILTPTILEMVLEAPGVAGTALPGQFVHLSGGWERDPLLRRPFSLARVDRQAGTITVFYRVVGRGTRRLATLNPGQRVDLLGPLGQGFSRPSGEWLLAGGGMGLAPLLFLAEEGKERGRPVTALLGVRTAAELFGLDLFQAACSSVRVATDDGSSGLRGTVAALLDAHLEGRPLTGLSIFACGPKPFLRRAARWSEHGLAVEVSLEEAMACGLGACRGCAVATPGGGYENVCSAGPVFPAGAVII
jgi:dihydroorotate dehydrogenase electron transfer subunit